MHFIKVMVSTLITAVLIGCAGSPQTSRGLYGDVAGPQSVKGSGKQEVLKRIYSYTADEVREAAEAALFRMGLNVEENDAKKGRVTAVGTYSSPPTRLPVTIAVYVHQVNPKPSTEMVLVVDSHFWPTGDMEMRKCTSDIVSAIQKVLSTYK